jgi:enoyl-CoA hydratase
MSMTDDRQRFNEHADLSELEGVLTVTFDREAKRNAIDDLITAALREGVRRLADRDDLRVMVIAARGEYFTAGIDLDGELRRRMARPTQTPGLSFRQAYREHHQLYDEFEMIEKPIVLVAQGHCLGAGVEMATACDFRFASTTATFSLPEINIAVLPGSGGATRLTRLIGPHWTKWMAMAGQSVDAQQAERIGLVHAVHPPDELERAVKQFVDGLAKLPGDALGAAKIVIDAAVDADRATQRHLDRLANTALFGTAEFLARTGRFTKQSST